MEAVHREGEATDYWMPPLVVRRDGRPVGRIGAGDSVLFCCRRGEREIQLTRAFVDEPFDGFRRKHLDPLTFVPLTLYHPDFRDLPVAFPPVPAGATIGETVSRAGLRQLRLAEREKYAHVTFFFNGGRTEPFPGETDRCVPSNLDDPPSALPAICDVLEAELRRMLYDFAVVNLATGDILGHSTELVAKTRCAAEVDRALGRLLESARRRGYWMAVTADHGVLEDHGPVGGPPNVAHTRNPVPFLVIDPEGHARPLRPGDALCDVAPTLLDLLGLPQPEGMTGRSLLERAPEEPGRVLLVIVDGWGLGAGDRVHPIELAETPTWDRLTRGPFVTLLASGEAVGLLPESSGNSEAGHMNLGAGTPVAQDELRIEQAIASGRFASNPAIVRAIDDARRRGGALHLVGLLSERSSHGRIRYVEEAARQTHGVSTFVHWIADGRSAPPQAGASLVRQTGLRLVRFDVEAVTVVGRGLALDRGGDYEAKTRAAYRALVDGVGRSVDVVVRRADDPLGS
ncbi:MAG: phosphoglycerate mutase (2,3-diphosphoglycerate-independent) [Candidatus Bipolaricaulis sp.]|nr:phosphoglycerate mutase (2,3-diphosphoglycerate-independent) [Candidatus Bipolaricaulis sp.]